MASPKPDALTQITRLLSATDKTRAQLIAALARRGYEQSEIEDAVERARVLGYLDDTRVAAGKASRELQAGWAGEALLGRLLGAGLEESTAHAAIKAAIAESGWTALKAARAVVMKKRLQGPKAARFLASRGFDEDVVNRVIGTGEFES